MPDYSVYNTIINSTNEELKFKSDDASYGYWVDGTVPSAIVPLAQSGNIQIKDSTGPAGTEGHLNYFIGLDSSISLFETYVTCPWGDHNNVIQVNPVNPQAVYEITWRAKTGDGDWKTGSVDTSGHPIWVEYTVQYQKSKRYRFQVNSITASSGHPVRNSRDELIVGSHKLWDRKSADTWNDKDKGSYQSNIFPHDFKSTVSSDSFFDVTIQVLNIELMYSDCMLYCTYKGQRIIQSDFFTIKTMGEFSVRVHVVKPTTSKLPFAWNVEAEWGMELHLSKFDVECVQPNTTPLEFYWIDTSLHRAFENGIPIHFLRYAVPKNESVTSLEPHPPNVQIPQNVNLWFQQAATNVFHFGKAYDTIRGASAFGVSARGGIFSQAYYFAANESGVPGSLYPYVNCMDQTAALELQCSLGGPRPSWLVQDPFGYINTTHLVGIVGSDGNLRDVNNPFFGTDTTKALIGQNDLTRTMFIRHIYTGNSLPFQLNHDAIYDATGGPHTGTENGTEFLNASLDTTTSLYDTYHQQHGTTMNIAQGDGVTGIDGHPWVPPSNLGSFPKSDQSRILALLGVGKVATPAVLPISIGHLAVLGEWVSGALGHPYRVAFEAIQVGLAETHVTWHLTAPGQFDVRLDLYIEAVKTKDNTVDSDASADAARERLGQIFTTFDRDPTTLFSKGPLTQNGEYCLQFSHEVPAGRIILVSKNVVFDLRGASSSASLEPIARALVAVPQGWTKDPHPLPIPVVDIHSCQAFPDASSDKSVIGTDTLQVTGINIACAYHFVLGSPIAAASAEIEGGGGGVLVSKCVIEEVFGGSTAVIFTFITRKVGEYNLDAHFTHATTLTSGTQRIHIKVSDK